MRGTRRPRVPWPDPFPGRQVGPSPATSTPRRSGSRFLLRPRPATPRTSSTARAALTRGNRTPNDSVARLCPNPMSTAAERPRSTRSRPRRTTRLSFKWGLRRPGPQAPARTPAAKASTGVEIRSSDPETNRPGPPPTRRDRPAGAPKPAVSPPRHGYVPIQRDNPDGPDGSSSPSFGPYSSYATPRRAPTANSSRAPVGCDPKTGKAGTIHARRPPRLPDDHHARRLTGSASDGRWLRTHDAVISRWTTGTTGPDLVDRWKSRAVSADQLETRPAAAPRG